MKPYRFLVEADAEFQEHIRYYDAQSAGLGDKFIADVEASITDIRNYPDHPTAAALAASGPVLNLHEGREFRQR